MSGNLNKLYSETIRSHNETPYHFEKGVTGQILKAYNPVCGDRFELFVEKADEKLISLHFFGFGCAISKASTSIMTKMLEGKTAREALKVCTDFLDFVDQKPSSDTLPEEFRAFSAVSDFPERYDCATLSWKEMKKFLESQQA
jgi:nitrogen fixation NifU-like protein